MKPPSCCTLLALVVTVLSGACAASDAGLRCTGQVAAPISLNLALGKAKLLQMPQPVQARSVGNPAVLHAMLVTHDALYVVGVELGSSNMIVQGPGGLCTLIEVVVGLDAGALQHTLTTLLPEQKDLQVSALGDTLVIRGTVPDAPTIAHVMELAKAFVRRPPAALETGKAGAAGNAAAIAPVSAAATAPTIINLMSVSAPQQVMLEVKIAEVSKSLLDKLEAGLAVKFGGGEAGVLRCHRILSAARSEVCSVSARPVATIWPSARKSRMVWCAFWPSRR